MDLEKQNESTSKPISFYGGIMGALFPFIVFVTGVIIVALSGAPDEKGFWPILILSLALGLFLSKDKNAFSETVIEGMSQKIVMIMITAWLLASIIGVLMTVTGFVEALTWIIGKMQMGGVGFIITTFVICSIVSRSTGSSFATILICGPILYPAGGLAGAHLATLVGAIIGGATFGDFIAPISDTTIASALSQKAKIGETVRSRIKYIVPASILALIAFFISGTINASPAEYSNIELSGDPKGLPMLIVPIVIITLFLKGKHLIYGLLTGLVVGVIIGLSFGLLPVDKIFALDLENISATSFIIDGINRAVGISFFTILLMGLVATLKSSGVIQKLVDFASERSKTKKQAEGWISGTVGAAVLLTTHSIVAILMVSEFANKTGEKSNINPIRRANILSLTTCVFPFLLPYFIPTILVANTTASGQEYGIPSVAPLQAGMYNFVAWALLLILILVIFFSYGRKTDRSSNNE
jgi:Na+/H+ antiporter NhaC